MHVSDVQSNLVCELCVGNHPSTECQVRSPFATNSVEQVNYVANNQCQFNSFSNTFNPGWMSHPKFSWSNNAQKPPPSFQSQEKKPNLEEMFEKFMQETTGFKSETRSTLSNQYASIRNLEHQMG